MNTNLAKNTNICNKEEDSFSPEGISLLIIHDVIDATSLEYSYGNDYLKISNNGKTIGNYHISWRNKEGSL